VPDDPAAAPRKNGIASLPDLAAERGAWENRATLAPAQGGRREENGTRRDLLGGLIHEYEIAAA
jgi:hypothetical protein